MVDAVRDVEPPGWIDAERGRYDSFELARWHNRPVDPVQEDAPGPRAAPFQPDRLLGSKAVLRMQHRAMPLDGSGDFGIDCPPVVGEQQVGPDLLQRARNR